MRWSALWISVALLFLVANAFSAPPSVDFNIYSSPSPVFTNVIFDPNVTSSPTATSMRWQFGSDGNANYTQDYNQIFFDNFNDGSFSPEWTTNDDGNWSAAAFRLAVVGNTGSGAPDGIANAQTVIDANRLALATDKNFILTADLNNGSIGSNLYVGLRNSSSHKSYSMWLRNGTAALYYLDGNTTYTLGSVAVGTNRATLSLEVSSNYVILKNGSTLLVSKIDTNINFFDRIWVAGEYAAPFNTSVDDVNLISNSTGAIPIDLNQTRAFLTTGNKDICLTVSNADGNTTACKVLTITGRFRLNFFDENTLKPFAPSNVLVNGVLTALDGNSLTLSTTSVEADYNVTAYDANKAARSFIFYGVSDSNILDFNLFLLDANKGKNIQFQFYHPNLENVLSGAIVYVVRSLPADNNYVGIVKLGGDAKAYFFLNPDANYTFRIDANANSDIDFNYLPIRVTVKIPLDEQNGTPITPYRFRVTNLASIDRNGLSANDSNTIIFANTVGFYRFTVSKPTGLNYTFARDYLERYYGNPLTATLQPYLAADADGTFNSSITAIDLFRGFPIEGLVVRSITNGYENQKVVESDTTDSTGRVLFNFIIDKDYFIEYHLATADLNRVALLVVNAQSSTYIFALNISSSDLNVIGSYGVDANYSQLVLDRRQNNQFDINWTVRSSRDNISRINWKLYDKDGNVLVDRNYLPSNVSLYSDGNTVPYWGASSSFGNYVVSTLLVTAGGADYNLFTVFLVYNPDTRTLQETVQGIEEEISFYGLTILALFFGLVIHRFFAVNAVADSDGYVFPLMLFVGIVFIIAGASLQTWGTFSLACIFSSVAWYWKSRVF